MTFHTRNSDAHAHRISESTAEALKQLWAAVIDQALFDATTRTEDWFDAIDFLLTERSDVQLSIVGLDGGSFRNHLLRAMESKEDGRVNLNRRKTFLKNLNEYKDRKRQAVLI